MTEGSASSTSRLAPTEAWRNFTDAPLLGCSLARETTNLLAWDDARGLYIFDRHGERRSSARAPAPVAAARISDDGTLIALLVGGPRLLLLDEALAPLVDRPAPSGPLALDIDPHGRFLVVATRSAENLFYSRHGKPAGKFTTRQPLTHIRFIPMLPRLVGAAGYGMMVSYLLAEGEPGTLRAELEWDARMISNLGRLETTGDGSTILSSSFNVGVQRFDGEGHNEGSYHLGGTAIHAVPDFPGRSIAAATQEGELCLLNRAGSVRWKTTASQPPVALEIDALGRFLILGLPSGEVRCLQFEGPISPRKTRSASKRPSGDPMLRPAEWTVPFAPDHDHAEAAVVAVLDDPPRIAAMTRTNRLQVFDQGGRLIHEAEPISGIGRIIRTSPGWIAAATDRKILLFNARKNQAHRPDIDLVELTHLIVRPEKFGLAIVQERNRVGRATPEGRWVWKKELRVPVEDLAIGPMGLTALTCDDGSLQVLDAAGEPAGHYQTDPPEPLLMVGSYARDAANEPTWITLARRAQLLRGHSPDGDVLWESPTPWEGWQLHHVGSSFVILAPDGRALAYNALGYLQTQSPPADSNFVLAPGPKGAVHRLARKDVHVICSDLTGLVVWRSIAEQALGPLAGGAGGVVSVQGTSLAWYGWPRTR
jgi:hypothetical protein